MLQIERLKIEQMTALILCCSLTPNAFAEVASDSMAELSDMSLEDMLKIDVNQLRNAEVTISSGGQGESRARAASQVTIFTRAEMENHGWRTVSDVLSNVPGLYVIDDLVVPSVGVRGVTGGLRSGSRIIKVMINGAAVDFRPDLTAFLGPEFLPFEVIERIEVAKGPLSAIYGANAFLATVNVITHSIGGKNQSEASVRGHYVGNQFGYGTSAQLTVGTDQLGLLVAFSSENLDRSGLALQQTFPLQTSNSTLTSLFKSSSQQDRSTPISGFFQFRSNVGNRGKVTVQGGIQRLDAGGEFQLNSLLTHHSRVALDNFWASAAYQHTWSHSWDATLTIGASRGEPGRNSSIETTQGPSSTYFPQFSYQAFNLAAAVNYHPASWVNFRAGVDAETDREEVLFYTERFTAALGDKVAGSSSDLISPSDSRFQRLNTAGFFIQAVGEPFPQLPHLHLTLNERLDKVAYGPVIFPLQESWRAAAAYEWNSSLTTRVIGGQAFQTPSGVQMFAEPGFGNTDNLTGFYTLSKKGLLGNLTLKPQRVTSVEGLVSAALGKLATLEAGISYQILDDKIEFLKTGSNFVAANQGSSRNLGFEGSARLSLGRVSPYLSGHVLLPFVEGTPTFAASSLFPAFMLLTGVSVPLPEVKLQFTGQLKWVGARASSQSNTAYNGGKPYDLPPFAQLDAALSTTSFNFFGPTYSTRFFYSIHNLLNEQHSEPGFGSFDVPTLGRTMFLDVRQNF